MHFLTEKCNRNNEDDIKYIKQQNNVNRNLLIKIPLIYMLYNHFLCKKYTIVMVLDTENPCNVNNNIEGYTGSERIL